MPSSSDSLQAQLNSNLLNTNPAIVSGIIRPPTYGSQEGVDLDELPIGAVLEIETGHTTYRLENKGDGGALLSGHPKYCPEPTVVQIQGSLGPSGELKWRFLQRGLKMAFLPPEHGIVRTSGIKSLRRIKPEPHN
jgi:hypothetical protein